MRGACSDAQRSDISYSFLVIDWAGNGIDTKPITSSWPVIHLRHSLTTTFWRSIDTFKFVLSFQFCLKLSLILKKTRWRIFRNRYWQLLKISCADSPFTSLNSCYNAMDDLLSFGCQQITTIPSLFSNNNEICRIQMINWKNWCMVMSTSPSLKFALWHTHRYKNNEKDINNTHIERLCPVPLRM